MGIFADYKQYQKYEPEYENWKKQKNLSEAKKLEYLKQNPADEKTKLQEIQRGKALLHAIDVMDEYSQSRAENMEIATKQAVGIFGETASWLGVGLGFLVSLIPPVKKYLSVLSQKYRKFGPLNLILPAAFGMVASVITTMFFQGWAASKEVGASRKGRFEAMKNELSNPKIFAVLNEEQKAKQKEIAEKIPTTKDMKKGVVAKKSNMLNPLNAFKLVKDMLINNEKAEKERNEFNNKLYSKPSKEIPLNETDILKAKKDQQLLHNVIEKLDTFSQEYAEKVELATQSVFGIALAGGALTAFVSNKIIKLLKVSNPKLHKIIPAAVGIITSLGTSIWAASVQKQASRVGRYLAKKEIEKDLNNYVYVDKEKSDKISDNIKIEEKEKKNFFKFIIQAFKDNFEYKKYIKTSGVKTIKETMALKDIKLTSEQEKEAKMLQKNTFKAFNKLDEKSQQYAESVEAVGEVVNVPITAVSVLAGMGLATWLGKFVAKSKMKNSMYISAILPTVGALFGIIPAILNNIYFTNKQIQASKVAHMLALNEMNDYKNYVDYDNLATEKNKTISNSNTNKQKNIFDLYNSFLKK